MAGTSPEREAKREGRVCTFPVLRCGFRDQSSRARFRCGPKRPNPATLTPNLLPANEKTPCLSDIRRTRETRPSLSEPARGTVNLRQSRCHMASIMVRTTTIKANTATLDPNRCSDRMAQHSDLDVFKCDDPIAGSTRLRKGPTGGLVPQGTGGTEAVRLPATRVHVLRKSHDFRYVA